MKFIDEQPMSGKMTTEPIVPILKVNNNQRPNLFRDISSASEDTAIQRRNSHHESLRHFKRNRSSSLLDLRRTVLLKEPCSATMHKVSVDVLKAAGLRPQFPNILSRRGTLIDANGTHWNRRFSFNVFNDKPYSIDEETGPRFVDADGRDRPGAGSLLVDLTNSEEAVTSFLRNGQCSGFSRVNRQDYASKNMVRNRRELFLQRRRICDFSLFFAFLGFAGMILEAELTSNPETGVSKVHPISLFLRSATFLSTLLLVLSVSWYHITELKIYLLDTGAEDWRLAVTASRVFTILLEMSVCSICPFPGTGTFHWFKIDRNNQELQEVPVPLDVLLSIPMFLRSYLIGRAIVLHSRHFQDTSVRTIAALNRTPVDFQFVLKTFMTVMPIHVLVVFTVTYWLCSAWILTLCERTVLHANYLNSVWLVIVTFMSIGYGDIVPQTYCGRSVAILTGIVGTAVSSVLIAVVSRKMELTKSEKHVNLFMADNRLEMQQKTAAASLVQHTWFIYKYRRCGRGRDGAKKIRHHQRQFLKAVVEFRRLKSAKRVLIEQSENLVDLNKMQNDLQTAINETRNMQQHVLDEVRALKAGLILHGSIKA